MLTIVESPTHYTQLPYRKRILDDQAALPNRIFTDTLLDEI